MASMDLDNIITLVFFGIKFDSPLYLAHHSAKFKGPVAKLLLQNVEKPETFIFPCLNLFFIAHAH